MYNREPFPLNGAKVEWIYTRNISLFISRLFIFTHLHVLVRTERRRGQGTGTELNKHKKNSMIKQVVKWFKPTMSVTKKVRGSNFEMRRLLWKGMATSCRSARYHNWPDEILWFYSTPRSRFTAAGCSLFHVEGSSDCGACLIHHTHALTKS